MDDTISEKSFNSVNTKMIIELKKEMENMKLKQQKFINHIEKLEECICSLSISDKSSLEYKQASKIATNLCHRKRPAEAKLILGTKDESVTSTRTSKSPPIINNNQLKVNYVYPKRAKVKTNDEKLQTPKDEINHETRN